ncbi:hypothetical protein Tco_1114188 [Tanacetum coccineum]|uniref:Uncharacterized protein n=1 Tax=Tanacetum coccineum TaxID=301880 RepID=A0ABQ5IVW2_9ASTR
MANPFPPGHNAEIPEVEPIQPEPSHDMPDPDEVLSDVEEDPEEEPEEEPEFALVIKSDDLEQTRRLALKFLRNLFYVPFY